MKRIEKGKKRKISLSPHKGSNSKARRRFIE